MKAAPWSVILDPNFTIHETAYLMAALDCRLELIGDEPPTLVPMNPARPKPLLVDLMDLLVHPKAPVTRPLRESLQMVSVLSTVTAHPKFGIAELCRCGHGADIHADGFGRCAKIGCNCQHMAGVRS